VAVERFEDLIAWQKARVLCVAIYRVTQQGPFGRDFSLSRQIQRAAVSTMSNIAEGFDRGNRGEFQQFLSVAKASCAEVRSQLYIAMDVGYLPPPTFEKLVAMAEEVSRIVGGLRSAVARQRTAKR
jgi:four helix bundle protein